MRTKQDEVFEKIVSSAILLAAAWRLKDRTAIDSMVRIIVNAVGDLEALAPPEPSEPDVIRFPLCGAS